MNHLSRTIAGAVIGATAALATVSAAGAQGIACSGTVRGVSNVQQSLTSATDGATPARIKRSYRAAFAIGRQQAIANWHIKVRQNCPNASPNWFRSRHQKVEDCDRAMGGRFAVCVNATPGRRIGGR